MRSMTITAILTAVLLAPATVRAQDWGGVAGIAAARGYSASPGMGMASPGLAVPAEPAGAMDTTTTPPPHAASPALEAERVPSASHHRQFAGRGRPIPHPSFVARARRVGPRHRARLA